MVRAMGWLRVKRSARRVGVAVALAAVTGTAAATGAPATHVDVCSILTASKSFRRGLRSKEEVRPEKRPPRRHH